MVSATRRELEKAHRRHRDHCGDFGSTPLQLLLFYSIECGLKALLMKERRVERYEDLPPEARINHDIVLGLMRLHAPPELMRINRLPVMTAHHRPPQQPVRPPDLHQAFRYAVPIDPEAEVVAELHNILDWVKE